MHEYDVTLKSLLRGSAQIAMRELTGVAITKWLDVELPRFQNPRVDLLGEAADQSVVHIELQSGNDSKMALRMAEYALGIYRLFGKFARQILVYVGDEPMQMESQLKARAMWFEYEIVEFRNVDGERLLASSEVGDNVLAILARVKDGRSAVHDILGALSELETRPREIYLNALLTLAGLRGLEVVVESEVRKLPVLNDILDHKVLGREYKRGLEQGLEQGLEKGLQHEASTLLHRLIEKRFGTLPAWAAERLSGRSVAELENLSLRVLDVKTVDELLK